MTQGGKNKIKKGVLGYLRKINITSLIYSKTILCSRSFVNFGELKIQAEHQVANNNLKILS